MRYAALLRGVNVGGNRRVPKLEFREVLEKLGFYDITIYVNSGNAVFTSDKIVKSGTVQTALEEHFGFTMPTLVISKNRMLTITAAIPDDWTNDAPLPDKFGQKSDVLYLFDGVNTPDILSKIGYKPELEEMMYVDGAVITRVSRANQSKGSVQRLISTALYSQITVRNVNTARKLAELM